MYKSNPAIIFVTESELLEQESLLLIQQMINKARSSYHDTGIGPILWGCVATICSIITYAETELHIWLFTIVAIIPQIVIISREKKHKTVKAYDNTVMNYIWTSFGVAISILSFINVTISSQLVQTGSGISQVEYGSYSSAFFLLLYGFPTIITGGYKKIYANVLLWYIMLGLLYHFNLYRH